MNKFGYNYLFGTLDFKSLNLSRYRHGGVNVTGFQLLEEPSSVSVSEQNDLVLSMSEAGDLKGQHQHQGFVNHGLPVQAALTVDSLSVIESAVSSLLKNDSLIFRWTFRRGELYNLNKTKGIPCSTRPPAPWMFGKTLLDTMKEASPAPEGLSASLEFDHNGYRKDFSLGVYSMALDHGLQKIGTWSPDSRFDSVHKGDSMNGFDPDMSTNESKIITSILSEPFLMLKKRKDGQPVLMGNDRYEGFSMDLATMLAEYVGFMFEFRLVADGNYGSRNEENGTWNGMMGELIDGTAHLAVAPLTITADRERYVDFSKPFMEIGVTIMIKKPQSQRPGVFSFMEPLSVEVWLCIIVAYLTVSVGLFLVSRFSPVEWRRVKGEGMAEYENDFSLFNSFWFSMGALMFQGSDTCPRSISGRIIGGAWWFFVLIIISSYTANLAAFLTVERMVTPIESADDLANHPTIKYGAVSSGTTLQFFINSEIPVYQQMGEYMMTHPEVLVQTNAEGIKRVLDSKGKYAFLAESALVDYVNNRKPCETASVGGKLNNKGFGVATKRNSPMRQALNVAVLKLKEEGTLHTLHQTWWIRKGQCGGSTGSKKGKLSLTLSNVAGIFYILIVGLVLAIVLGVTEFTCFRAKNKTDDTCTITGDGCLKPNDALTNDGYLKNTNTLTTLCTTPNEREDWAVVQELNGAQRPDPPSYDACIGFERFGTGPVFDRPSSSL
ncbi:glutamate receptor [Plakobranchus ocellatus]|uniref:Glutamate receptor n=1 Tax=Plakobranchus ocellatus TaxID=259542 RepID=A0AAV3Z2F0_9GAST|nr:glutamate receptor [Plakobranchus ocellatus]